MDRETLPVTNNEAESRFEAAMDGHMAMLQYRKSEGVITFVHTEVPSEFEGRGAGGQLVRTGLEYARSHALKVVPLCSFVAGSLKRHPEYIDLVVEKYKSKVQQS